jgi:hypothetical protein
MLIKHQDGYSLINLDNVQVIQTNAYGEIFANTNSENTFIGKYETLNRAKEVLEEIQQCYRNYKSVDGIKRVSYAVYKMPEK